MSHRGGPRRQLSGGAAVDDAGGPLARPRSVGEPRAAAGGDAVRHEGPVAALVPPRRALAPVVCPLSDTKGRKGWGVPTHHCTRRQCIIRVSRHRLPPPPLSSHHVGNPLELEGEGCTHAARGPPACLSASGSHYGNTLRPCDTRGAHRLSLLVPGARAMAEVWLLAPPLLCSIKR